MRLQREGLLVLRWSCLRFTLLAVLAALLVWWAHRAALRADAAQASEIGLQRELRAALLTPPEADEDAEYRRISSSGIIGPEQRHGWVLAIEAAVEAHRILDLRYEFAPRGALPTGRPARPNTGERHAGLALASRMSLRMGLLHEEDLLRFFGDLAQAVPAMLRIQRCQLEPAAEDAWPARLSAECTVDWITLEERQ